MKKELRMWDLRSSASSSLCLVFSAALLATTAASATAATPKKALILDTTVQGGATSREALSARTAGFDVTVADAATWTGGHGPDGYWGVYIHCPVGY